MLQLLDRSNWPLLMAGCVVMTATTILMFAVVQRSFLRDSPFGWRRDR